MFPLNFLASQKPDTALADNTVDLSPEMVRWADQLAQTANTVDARDQWQVYLRSLAIAGFASWISQSQASFSVHYDRQSATGICYVAEHRIAVLPVTAGLNRQICVHQAALSNRAVKLFVFVAVQIKSQPAKTVPTAILGALRSDQLPSELIGSDCLIEVTQLNPAKDLLLHLESLCKARLQPPARPSLNKPLDWIQLSSMSAETFRDKSAPSDTNLTILLSQFSAANIEFPPETSGFYTDLAIAEHKLRLHALVWPVVPAMEPVVEPALSLFLILGPIAGSYLPMGTRLTVKENNLLLTDQNLHWTSHPVYLYTQVFGTWKEKFTVEVLLPNARPIELPPLSFEKAPQT